MFFRLMPGTERLKSALADRYAIERELGSGGMATVYLARDLKHDREVALKVLRADLSAVIGTERFLSEVRITAKLDHPHILTLIDSGEADGILYYVLPFVRGEALRGKLERERQLTVDDSTSIIRQIAGALDYAHARGIVHRDIKPENILLHEGEAMLADFGIALAVKEAGGPRLTETGISLGTPMYMSPEQATGDRSLDGRTDIYSLAAVFYEMLAGEPPLSGPNAQAIIAKLLTEKPIKLRVVRPALTRSIEAATDRALSKTPADRFASAGEFVRALSSPSQALGPPRLPRVMKWLAGIAAAGVIITGLWMASAGLSPKSRTVVALRDRRQLTNTGEVRFPVISPDGKAFAYAVTECNADGCRYAVQLQDIDGAGRRLLHGASGVYGIEISPDRRNVLFNGTLNGVYGAYLVPALGGEPKRISNNSAGFFADGDSLLITRYKQGVDTVWILVAGLDGVPADSIRLVARTDLVAAVASVPGTNRILVMAYDGPGTRWHSIDRQGDYFGTLDMGPGVVAPGNASVDALWIMPTKYGVSGLEKTSVVRIPFDTATGKFGSAHDTVYTGNTTYASVTADGTTLMLDEGLVEYSMWAMSFDDMINGRFTEDKRIHRSTRKITSLISPDGKRLLFDRDANENGRLFAVMSYPSGPEIGIPGTHRFSEFADSTLITVVDLNDKETKFSLFDVRTRELRPGLSVSEVGLRTFDWLGSDTWIWSSPTGEHIRIQRTGDKQFREIKAPGYFGSIGDAIGSPDGQRAALVGWKATSGDSLAFGVMRISDGKFTPMWSRSAENAWVSWLDNESIFVAVAETLESLAFYRLRIDGKLERLGATRRPTHTSSVSRDLKKAVTVTRDQRADAWTMKVVR